MLAIIPVVATLGLIASLAMIILRYTRGKQGVAKPPGGGLWILTLVALWLWWSAISAGLAAQAKRTTVGALSALPLVSAQDIQRKPELVGAPVVVSDTAHCAERLPGGVEAVAVRTTYSGQEEIEGENYDYIEVRTYGSDAEVARFTLGAPNSPVRVDNDLMTVLASRPAERVVKTTNEYSPAAGGNLQEYEDRQFIPCGAHVNVTGMVVKKGDAYLLEPLGKSTTILTDRHWSDVLTYAGQRVSTQERRATFWFLGALAVGLLQLAIGLAGRKAA